LIGTNLLPIYDTGLLKINGEERAFSGFTKRKTFYNIVAVFQSNQSQLMRKLAVILLFIMPIYSWAAQTDTRDNVTNRSKNLVDHRFRLEKRDFSNPFVVSFYKPTYVLPFYYHFASPSLPDHNAVPNQQKLQNTEFKFQISFKVPVWRDILGFPSTLYAAYTQSSFWQAYSHSPFFRETNYEPEVFLTNDVDIPLVAGWHAKFLNMGAVHQSNGRGGSLERSWNRLYFETTFAKGNWMVTLKPWYIFHDASFDLHNPNIADYMGHGHLVLAYKYGDNTLTLMSRNSLESGFKRGAVELSWSYPLLTKVKGYVQVFSGYGQSLIDYNHYTKGAGIGFALSDWI
jgi:phospholipase A1